MTIIFKGTRPDHNIVYVQIYIYTRADTGGGNRGLSPPEQFQGGGLSPPENCPPPEQFRGGTAKMSPP